MRWRIPLLLMASSVLGMALELPSLICAVWQLLGTTALQYAHIRYPRRHNDQADPVHAQRNLPNDLVRRRLQ